jgi:hypothetical protein
MLNVDRRLATRREIISNLRARLGAFEPEQGPVILKKIHNFDVLHKLLKEL